MGCLEWPDPTECMTREEEIALEGGHACPDWDYLVIYLGDPEMDCCSCDGFRGRSVRTLDDIEDEDAEMKP